MLIQILFIFWQEICLLLTDSLEHWCRKIFFWNYLYWWWCRWFRFRQKSLERNLEMAQAVKVWLDKGFLKAKGSGELLTNLEKNSIQVIIESLPIENSIFWTRVANSKPSKVLIEMFCASTFFFSVTGFISTRWQELERFSTRRRSSARSHFDSIRARQIQLISRKLLRQRK